MFQFSLLSHARPLSFRNNITPCLLLGHHQETRATAKNPLQRVIVRSVVDYLLLKLAGRMQPRLHRPLCLIIHSINRAKRFKLKSFQERLHRLSCRLATLATSFRYLSLRFFRFLPDFP